MAAAKIKEHKCDVECAKRLTIKGLISLGVCWVATKLLWDWIVPDLFPTGLLAGTISWLTAFKLALVSTGLMILKMLKKHKMIKLWKMKIK